MLQLLTGVGIDKFLKTSPNLIILIITLGILLNGIISYRKRDYRTLFIYLLIACLFKYILTVISFNFNNMFTFYFGIGNDLLLKLTILVDIISLILGIFAYKNKKYNILLFFVILSILFQYLNLIIK